MKSLPFCASQICRHFSTDIALMMNVLTFLAINPLVFVCLFVCLNEANGNENTNLVLAECADYVFCSQVCSDGITQQYEVVLEAEIGCVSHLARFVWLV